MEPTLFHGEYVESKRIVYTPSSFAKNNLIYLQEVGTLKSLKPHSNRRKELSSFLFFIAIEGSGTVEYHNTTYTVKAGDCVFLDCRSPYAHYSSNDLWQLIWVHFSGPNMGEIYEKFIERSGGPCFTPSHPGIYEHLHTNIFDLASSVDYIRDMRLTEYLTTLLTHMMEDCWQKGHTTKPSRARQDLQPIKEYLDTHYTKKILLDDLAEKFFINKFHLARIFKEQFGISINQYLIQARITQAKQLLRFSNLSIEEVGQRCGMGGANYFSRIFKKVEGVSPGHFRRVWKSKNEE